MLAPESSRAWSVQDDRDNKTDRWIGRADSLDKEVPTLSCLKTPTSAEFETASFPNVVKVDQKVLEQAWVYELGGPKHWKHWA